ncbi:MAG: ATP-binding protein [Balneolaceae bacterium]
MGSSQTFSKNIADIYRRFFEQAPIGMVLYRRYGNQLEPVMVNDAFCDYTGYSLDQIKEQAPLLKQLQREDFRLYQRVLESVNFADAVEARFEFDRSDGEKLAVRLCLKPIQTADNELYFAGYFFDLADEAKSEHERKMAMRQMEESLQLADKFLTNISHEIRTPMTGIIGMSELMLQTDLSDQQKEYVRAVQSSTKSLLAIINDALEYHEVSSSSKALESEPFELAGIVKDIERLTQFETEKKEISLSVHISEEVPPVLIGDEHRLHQILMHLMSNAIKFTDRGRIELNAGVSERANRETVLYFTLSDTGIGIPDPLKKIIFERFSKAARATHQKYGGTGLGLSIVNQLVQRMGGIITVEDREGGGTVFTVKIPFQVAEGKEKRTERNQASISGTQFDGYRCLVVDDYPINRGILVRMLERLGAEIDEAETGEHALEKLTGEIYDLVLMDVHMPGKSGIEVTREVRGNADSPNQQTPILAITASVMDKDVEACMEAGMNGFLGKPYTYAELTDRVSACLPQTPKSRSQEGKAEKKKMLSTDLQLLRDLSGDEPEIMREMLDLYLDNTPELLDQLDLAMTRENYREAARYVHKLKPTLGYVDEHEAFKLARQIDEMADSDTGSTEFVDQIHALTDLVRASIGRVQELKSHI